MTEIAAIAGQKILLSGRGSYRQTVSSVPQEAMINGNTIKA